MGCWLEAGVSSLSLLLPPDAGPLYSNHWLINKRLFSISHGQGVTDKDGLVARSLCACLHPLLFAS